jgi:signal recognition particle receptor subunit beta/serine/threonine protein kinase
MRINAAAQEIILKVVYYGPGMAGKTTNLTVIHDRVPSHAAGDLVMVDTHSERTLRFDLLAMDAGDVNGHRVHFEFFTVPGQSYYAATRRAVLAGADAVVFVADSRREALDENIEAMNEMLGNLLHHGLPNDLPIVVQYNKQDLPTALKREQLEPLMNVRGWPSMSAVAVDGNGVMETMQMVTSVVLDRVRRSGEVPESSAAEAPASGTWLISCFRCQAMLEVPDAKIGTVYACGICGSALEVVDADRGLTRAPGPAALTVAGNQSQQSAPDESRYGMHALPDRTSAANGALGKGGTPGSGSAPVLSQPYDVPGYDSMAPLDESAQGRRTRVRERSSGRTLRALALNPALMRQPSYSDNFESHVRLASQVKHPYILPLVAMSQTTDSRILLSADPSDYEPLGHVLARRRALAPPHAMGIIRQVALALEEAARHGVVHGWLRPDIILVSAEGNVLVDEFSVPKHHRFLVRELSGASAATEYYLAPEHLSEDIRSDVRSDIFMLGALMFRMMTGEGLVTGYNAHEALHKVIANGARTLRSVQPGVSRDLDLFCQKLVSAERKDRCQSYREVIDALDKFGGGAKRQTLRLTQNIPATQNQNTAQTRRVGTGQLRRTGTGQIPRGLGGGTTQVRRNTPISGERPGAAVRVQPGNSGAGVGIVVVAAIVIVGALAYFLFNPPAKGMKPATVVSPVSDVETNPLQKPVTPVPKPSVADAPATKPSSTPKDPLKAATESGPNTRTPSWLDVNQKPVAESAGSAVAEAPIAVTPEERASLLTEIAELERKALFKQAMAKCERLPTVEERQARILQVVKNHQSTKGDVQAQIALAKDYAEVERLTQPALEWWGMPEDDVWAKEQLASAEKRLGKGGAKPEKTSDRPAVEHVEIDPAALVDGQIGKDLASGQTAAAQQKFTSLPAGVTTTTAIKRKLDLFDKRSVLLEKVLSERHPKMRVPHPVTKDMWDILKFTTEGITVASAVGSKTDLTWSQVSIKDVARLCGEISNAPTAQPDDFSLATIMYLIAENTDLAAVSLKRGKGQLDPAMGVDLDLLVTFARQRDALELVARAKAAAAEGNAKTFNDSLEMLKRADDKVKPLVAAAIVELERLRVQPAVPNAVTGGPASASRDTLLFNSPDDLKLFTSSPSAWQVKNGMATNMRDGAFLNRRDINDARAAQLIFMPMNNRGRMTVDFRGVRFEFDFPSNTYRAISKEETATAKPFNFIVKTACSMYFEVRQPGNLITVTVNNGADSTAIRAGDTLTDNLGIVAEDGANIAIDELQIMRGKAATNKGAQGDLKKLGLDPLGDAVLEAPTIVLPETRGAKSGVAMALSDPNVVGASYDVKGIGSLRIQLGSPTDMSGEWRDVPLSAVAVTHKVSWLNDKLLVKDAAGNELASVALTGKHTHLMILALKEATLLSTPRLTYR